MLSTCLWWVFFCSICGVLPSIGLPSLITFNCQFRDVFLDYLLYILIHWAPSIDHSPCCLIYVAASAHILCLYHLQTFDGLLSTALLWVFFCNNCGVLSSIEFLAMTISTTNFGAFFYIICCAFSSIEPLSLFIGTYAFLLLPPAHILYLYHLATSYGLLSTALLWVFF